MVIYFTSALSLVLFVQLICCRSRIKELQSTLRASSDVCDKSQDMLREKRKEADSYLREVILLRAMVKPDSEEELRDFQRQQKTLEEQKEILKDILPHLNVFGTIPALSDEGVKELKKHLDFDDGVK